RLLPHPPPTAASTLSLHDALPILGGFGAGSVLGVLAGGALTDRLGPRRTILVSMAGSAVLILAILYLHSYPGLLVAVTAVGAVGDRKSTRLNSSHVAISYAVFCLK